MEPLELGQWYRFTSGYNSYIMIYHGRSHQGRFIIEQAYGNGGMQQEYISPWTQDTLKTFKIEPVPVGTKT